jgi:predicted amidohydrolase YtcJ
LEDKKIFTAKSIYLDSVEKKGFSFVVEKGQITAIGKRELVLDQFPFVKEESLDGYVYPAFFDAHVHLGEVSLLNSSIDATNVSNFNELLGLTNNKESQVAFIYNLDFNKIVPEEFFKLFKSNNKLFIQSKDEHSVFVSMPLLDEKEIKIGDVQGGELLYVDGQFAGVFKDNAIHLVKSIKDRIPSHDDINKAQTYFLRRGITSVVNFDFSVYQILTEIKDVLEIRIVQGIQKDYLDQFVSEGIKTNDGDAKLKIGPVKCFLDGSLGSQTAYMKNSFPFQGLLTMSESEFKETVMLANSKGIQVAVHAIGSGAVNIALRVFKDASNPLLRNRIEHLQFIDENDLNLLRITPFIASMQPTHAISDYHLYKKFMSSFRYAYAWRTVKNASKIIAFGSDAPVEDANPILGIYAASKRKTLKEGLGYLEEETISVSDAINAYTFGSTFASFSETYIGQLKEDYIADFVVVDKSLIKGKILESKVLSTYIGGEIAWTK